MKALILLTFKDAAYEVLLKYKKPLHYIDITRIILEEGLAETDGKTPGRTLNTDISRDINTFKEESRFIRVGKGTYSVNPKYSSSNSPTIDTAKDSSPNTILSKVQNTSVEEVTNKNYSLYVGKAGEYAVASELLFKDYNVSMMSVDEGIDIIASKKDKTYNIQVKTSHENQFYRYVSDIRISSFEKHNTSNTFYIFVLKSDKNGANFLIFPYYRIKEFIDQRIISSINSNTRYRVNIFLKEELYFLGNQDNDVSYFYNNWKIIT